MPIVLASSEDSLLAGLAIGGGILIALVGMVTGMIRSIVRSRHTEQTRREVAAYVAEGSMTAEDAAKIMRAGQRRWDKWGASDIA